eukprot:m.340405 g.340405  ORF g.340405 m.340405 type:complete len:294 (-) comp19276_c0_seq1:257-1138(-)
MIPFALLAIFLLGFPGSSLQQNDMPLPFTRNLKLVSPPMEGNDVLICQAFLNRVSSSAMLKLDGVFGEDTAKAVCEVRGLSKATADCGVVDAALAERLIEEGTPDGYKDDGSTAKDHGLLYKVHVPVHRNRSYETNATLYNADGDVLLTFRVRAHGHVGRNQFSSDGNTPTGLYYLDFNSPEPDPISYGPYPINRAVAGIHLNNTPHITNAALLVPGIRHGILMHTGEWNITFGWKPPMPMPNSEGCIHSWPQYIHDIAEILPTLGVKMRPNSGGKQPYPYTPQGLLSVELID